MNRLTGQLVLAMLIGVPLPASRAEEGRFANFESPVAHGIAISASGERLYAVNPPGNCLAVLSLARPANPQLLMQIPVGLEPVSVAERSDQEVWVVNHLSDSVSVIDLQQGVVVRTIQVGDRPGDIVFADQGRLAFVSSMNEGNVHVIDTDSRSVVRKIPVPAHSPRTLAAGRDGRSVWVASYLSGNRTTIIPHHRAPPPPPPENRDLPAAPAQGILVDTADPQGRETAGFELNDDDVFQIDVESLSIGRRVAGVGTVLFNLALHPTSNAIWVANTDARNLIRFEPRLKGHVVDNRISRISPSADTEPAVTVNDLNPHIVYQELPDRTARETALAQPTDIVFTPSGNRAFVASFGTDRIGVLDGTGRVLTRIELGDAPASQADPQGKRGPRSLALHPHGKTLYVLNRLSNSISAVDTETEQPVAELSLEDPTPEAIRSGRGYLFDARLSGNGTVSCASCHVDGDRDGLAWDLGDPGGAMFGNGTASPLHPMKGPLLTQTLRGLEGEKLFHWRADRPGLESFNRTFEDLLGGQQLAEHELALFVDYLQSIRFGPNPLRNRDDSLPDQPAGTSARDGQRIFMTRREIGRQGRNTFRCIDCHMRENGAGTTGFGGLIGQPAKAAQLRGLNERLVFDGQGTRISGFGFGADGSRASLPGFLADSHRFAGISDQEKAALQRFLRSFPTGTPPIVGLNRTLDRGNRDDPSIRADLALMTDQADLGNCTIRVHGLLQGEQIGLIYDHDRRSFRSEANPSREMDLQRLLKQIRGESHVSFVALPFGGHARPTTQ